MPSASRRQRILEALFARLEAIRVGATFQTDAGRFVYVNETPGFGPDDAETAIALVIGVDVVRVQGNKVFVALPIEVQALASAGLKEGWRYTEPVLADIKRALELEDRTLGGLVEQWLARGSTRTLERDEGSTTVGVAVGYEANYSETWGNP